MAQETNQNKNLKNFSQKVFGAEENSAATIADEKLSRYSDVAIKMFHTSVLSPKEKAWPAAAMFGTKMLKGLDAYKMLYYVNVLKIDMMYVTLILTLISIYDVLNNPIMGSIYDHSRTRWGKARPYIIFAAVPYFLSTALLFSGGMFLGETRGNDPKKIIFLFVMLFIQETLSTIYSIPNGNMVTLMSPNPRDRINVGLLQTYIGEFGAQTIYGIFLPLVELGNKGYLKISLADVFAIIGCVTSTIACISSICMAIQCKERILLQPKPAPVTKTMFYILKNKYSLRNFIAAFSVEWWATGGYSWDVVTQMEIFGGTIYSFIAYLPYNILQYFSIALIPKFQKLFKHNNKRAVLWLRFWDMLSATTMTILGVIFVEHKWAMIAIYGFFYALDGLNNAPATVFEDELAREINDYTEYVTGERPDGTVSILTDLIKKVTDPINAVLTVWLFKWTGYDSTLKMLPWSQGSKTVYQKVFFLFTGISIFPRIIKAIPYFFYDLVGEKREAMYIALNERRALIANEDDGGGELEEMLEMLESEGTEN